MDLTIILEQVRDNITNPDDRGKIGTVITQIAFMQEELDKTNKALNKITQAWAFQQADNLTLKRLINNISKQIGEYDR